MEKGPGEVTPKPFKLLAPGAGFEPATNRLTVDCSTAELSGIGGGRIAALPHRRKPFTTLPWQEITPSPVRLCLASDWLAGGAAMWLYAALRNSLYGNSRMASWRSGYAEDCKSLHPGSIPGEASNLLTSCDRSLRPRHRRNGDECLLRFRDDLELSDDPVFIAAAPHKSAPDILTIVKPD